MSTFDKSAARSSRRRFLQAGAALAGGSAVGALGGTEAPAQALANLADVTLDAKTLAAIKMPNRNDFVPDPRPDVK
jgi:hypothetical protein